MAWQKECANLQNLSFCHYGGGEDFKLCIQQEYIIEHEFSEERQLREKLVSDSNEWIEIYLKIPKDKQVASVPNVKFKVEELEWRNTILVAKSFPQVPHYNILTHGRVLANEFQQDKNRLGASSWPLAGLYKTHNIHSEKLLTQKRSKENKTGDISPWVGYNWVNAVDQHCHWVEEFIEIEGFPIDLSAWHIGGDMGRFSVANNEEIACGWLLWMCPVRKLAQLSWIMITPTNYDQEQIKKVSACVSSGVWLHCEQML